MGAAQVQYLEHQFKEKIAHVAIVIKCYITVTVLLQIGHLLDNFVFLMRNKVQWLLYCTRELCCSLQH